MTKELLERKIGSSNKSLNYYTILRLMYGSKKVLNFMRKEKLALFAETLYR
jgi:hypothetical protein